MGDTFNREIINHIGAEIATRNNCSVNFARKFAVSFRQRGCFPLATFKILYLNHDVMTSIVLVLSARINHRFRRSKKTKPKLDAVCSNAILS
jgi:hypothetical protein